MTRKARSAVPTVVAALLCLVACGRHGAGVGRSVPSGIPGANLTRGKAIYLAQCAACHGAQGAGTQIGVPLVNERARRSYKDVRAIVADPAAPMPKLYPSRISKTDVRDVSAYVESL